MFAQTRKVSDKFAPNIAPRKNHSSFRRCVKKLSAYNLITIWIYLESEIATLNKWKSFSSYQARLRFAETCRKKASAELPKCALSKASLIFNLIGLRLKHAARGKKRADVKMFSLTNFELKSIKQQFKNSSIVNFKTICEFAFSVRREFFIERVVGGQGAEID